MIETLDQTEILEFFAFVGAFFLGLVIGTGIFVMAAYWLAL
jgi:hypothetical protein